MPVAKIIELIGTSNQSFEDAVQQVIKRATKTLRHVSGLHIVSQKINLSEGKIVEYRVNVKVAFGIDDLKKK
ncbi:Dodecin [Candidatus Tiddalikarchaeum anstoanum]|nr:Dodecin [Candidatus Tiddalikarchaeum anstoanum]